MLKLSNMSTIMRECTALHAVWGSKITTVLTTSCMFCRVQLMQADLSQPGSTWYMLKLSNMSTIMREWTALHAVQDLKFKDVLLSASRSSARRASKLLIPEVSALVSQETDAAGFTMLS